MTVELGETGVASEALVDFCRRTHPVLVGAVGLYLGDGVEAEDIAQETLLRVCRRWSEVRQCDSPEAWAMRVAFNLARSRLRRLGAGRRALRRLSPSREAAAAADAASTIAVRAAVRGLPDRERRAVVLRYFADLPVSEVATLLGCPEGTVKTLTRRAVLALRRAGLEVDDDA